MREASQPLSRSQQVRQRRQQQSHTRSQRASEQVRRQAPPVVSRGGLGNVPVQQRARNSTRRTYYYTLSTPGAEVRLPALPNIRVGWRLFSAALTLILGAALYSLWNSPMFQLTDAKVNGAQRISAQEINQTLSLEGAPVIQVSPAEIETKLRQAYPDLSGVSVKVGLPASLVITVQERQPVLVWKIKDETQWIDQEGIAFPARGAAPAGLVKVEAEAAPPAPASAQPTVEENQAASDAPATTPQEPAVPQAATDVTLPYLSPDLIQPILAMAAQAPAGKPILYSPRYGLGWKDPKGWKVYFGMDVTHIDLKLKEYQEILAQLKKKDIKPKLISMEFLEAPFYRLEP